MSGNTSQFEKPYSSLFGRNRLIKLRRNLGFIEDSVARRDKDLRDSHHVDNELVWYLSTQSSLLKRDTELPQKLKKKAEAWLNSKRENLSEHERHLMIARAIPVALCNTTVDDTFMAWLTRHRCDRDVILMFNKMMSGNYVPKRGAWSRFLNFIGCRRLSFQAWQRQVISILPPKI